MWQPIVTKEHGLCTSNILNSRVHNSMWQLNPGFMWFYFTHKDMPYSLRKGPAAGLPKTHLVYYSRNAAHFLGSLI